MKKCFALLAMVAFACAFAQKVPAEWTTRYANLSKIIANRDFKSFQGLIGDKYLWVLPDGTKKNRKQALADFEALMKSKNITGGEKVLRVVTRGDQVEVSYDAHWKVIGADGKMGHFHEKGTDTWKKFGGGKWHVIKTVDTISEGS